VFRSAGIGGLCIGETTRCRCCRVIMNRKFSIWPSHIRGARTAARILEKQDRLRVSQVFFSVSVHQPSDGLAFQGFYKAGPRNLRVPDSDISSPRTHKSKTQTHYAARGVLPGPLTNFGPAKARPLHPTDAAPNPTMLPLDLAGLRRGLASVPSRNPSLGGSFLYYGSGAQAVSAGSSYRRFLL